MTNVDVVYLVNARNDPSIASMSNDYSFPALGVLALGTWLKKRFPDLEVIARDGAAWSTERITEEIVKTRPDLVGVSVLCTSYQNSLDIAKAANSVGAKVVFGNDQSSQTSSLILEYNNSRKVLGEKKERPIVDYVIGAEYGELDLELLIRHLRGEKIELSKISTLTYRNESGQVVGFDYLNPEHRRRLSITDPTSKYQELWQYLQLGIDKIPRIRALDIFPIVDRNLYPDDHWQKYSSNYLSKFWKLHLDKDILKKLDKYKSNEEEYRQRGIEEAKKQVMGVTTINRAGRGCNRQEDRKCKHCDMLLDISMSSPKLFWEEVKAANKQVKSTSFYECCDSFSSFPGLIKKIAEIKPHNLGFNPDFYVYCQAIDLADHPERVDMLKEIGVFRVNMGLESMSDRTLKHMKGLDDSVDKNYRALQLLKDSGIHVYGSFVLGSEAETPKTLDETVKRVCELIKGGYLCDAEAQPVLPLHGNYQGRVLREHSLMTLENQPSDWPLDVDELSKRYIDAFSGVTHKQCIEATIIIRECAKEHGINFGSGVSKEENYR